MSTLDSCCSPCPTVQTVNYPGAQGAQGAAGTPGTDGENAYAIVQAPGFTIPAVGNDVLAPVSSTLWMAVGEFVIAGTGFGGPVCGPANFLVISINSATTVTLRALAYPGDAVNPATIAASALLAPAGQRGATGAAGAAGSVFPTTTAGDIMVNTDGVAAHAARLGIGTQGQGLYADPSTAVPANILRYVGNTWVLNTNITSVGTGADTTEDNLMGFLVVANQLRNNGDQLIIEAVFDVVSSASVTNKTIKIKYGGTTVAQFGAAALDGGSVIMRAYIHRLNATGQLAYAEYITTNSAGTATVKIIRTSPGETLANAIQIQCTGQNGVDAVANGIVQQILKVEYRAVA